jgi:hypothetical protein
MMRVLSRTESTPFSLTPEGREKVRVLAMPPPDEVYF